MWRLVSAFRENLAPHSLQANGRLPVWHMMCCLQAAENLKFLKHTLQIKDTLPSFDVFLSTQGVSGLA